MLAFEKIVKISKFQKYLDFQKNSSKIGSIKFGISKKFIVLLKTP